MISGDGFNYCLMFALGREKEGERERERERERVRRALMSSWKFVKKYYWI
jgi:hypothetical protein